MLTSITDDSSFVRPKKYDPANLKILIISTPKTGNTWLKHLLATIYNLPVVYLPGELVPENLVNPGPRWISHHHFYPQSSVTDWAEQNQVVLITTIRHPGDAFISLYNHSRNFTVELFQLDSPAHLMGRDNNHNGSNSIAYLKNHFPHMLSISLSWMRSQKSIVVRYEDLWRDPVATLQKLTDTICEVPLNQLGLAVDLCSIALVRNSANAAQSKFFRTGKIGNWRKELSPEVMAIFRTLQPYPAQFAALGYTLDPNDPLIDAPPVVRKSESPFQNVSHFDNGLPISSALAKLYLSLDPVLKQGWASVEKTTSPNSFFSWLDASAYANYYLEKTAVPINNVAKYVYQERPDLQQVFPDISGSSRLDYLIWFMLHGRFEHRIEQGFIKSMYDYFVTWSNQSVDEDPAKGTDAVVITNLAAYIYKTRPDLQQVFPDIYGSSRLDYLIWFMLHGRFEHRIERTAISNMYDCFLEWSIQAVVEDPCSEASKPVLTNLAAYIYRTRPDLQQKYPDLYGKNRLDYLSWLLYYGYISCKLDREVLLPILLSLNPV
ncbi:MAG: sulfotransferase domain-containing protein [Chloroflexi bacterium]|nr:sulfotransferase domain-containing protein [Chloroflexota bacterium]